MALNYLSYATLPLPRMGHDFMLAQDGTSIFRYISLCLGESVNLKSTRQRSYLFVFLGQVKITAGADENIDEHFASGEAYRLDEKADLIEINAAADSVIYHVDSTGLEKLVSWSVVSRLMEGNQAAARRLNLLMNYSSLNTLPVDSAFELSQRMIEKMVNKGDDIVKQGDPADSFYILTEGTAEVWQSSPDKDESRLVAHLSAGDSFGEDALITEGNRNATVHMTSKGNLLICKRDDFQELIAHRSIDEVSSNDARKLIENNRYHLVDVRYQDEYDEAHLDNASLIPLSEIRTRLNQFNHNQGYILYCNDGQRSAVGAMILARAGIKAVSLRDGMQGWSRSTTED